MTTQYSNLFDGFIQEVEDGYMLMKNKKDSNQLEVEYIFKSMGDDKVESIQEMITDINEMISERKRLQKDIFGDLEKVSLKLANFMSEKKEELTPEELVNLQRKIIEIDEAKSKEKLAAWKDVADLKKELREHMRELKEKKDNMKMLESMVEL